MGQKQPIVLEPMILSFVFCSLLAVLRSRAPLLLALSVLVLAILIGMMLIFCSQKWIALSLLMVFVGGMMISFVYVTALAHNIKFCLSFPYSNFLWTVLLSIMIFYSGTSSMSYLEGFKLMYSLPAGPVMLLLIAFLLMILFYVVKFSQNFKGSLLKER